MPSGVTRIPVFDGQFVLPLAVSVESALKTRGRVVREWGHMGVTQMASSAGSRMGPPAEREYAVEPVGVAIITPSA